uniref:Activated RNA polymerase II transcriptional coactivator p15 n=1 Tax=Amphiprion percula TaxID=161767 RepID=A0A3P8T0W9_AMPPE
DKTTQTIHETMNKAKHKMTKTRNKMTKTCGERLKSDKKTTKMRKYYKNETQNDKRTMSKNQSGECSKPAGSSKGSGNGGNNMFQIGKMRYVSVGDFKGEVLIDIRVLDEPRWTDEAGEKSISLSPEQWNQLKHSFHCYLLS